MKTPESKGALEDIAPTPLQAPDEELQDPETESDLYRSFRSSHCFFRQHSQYTRRISCHDRIRGNILRHHAAGADNGVLADRNSGERIVAPEPIEAPFFTSVGSTFQSASVCRPTAGRWRADTISLMNVTP